MNETSKRFREILQKGFQHLEEGVSELRVNETLSEDSMFDECADDVFLYEDFAEDGEPEFKQTLDDHYRAIREFVVTESINIVKDVRETEASKSWWRKFFMWFLMVVFGLTFVTTILLSFFYFFGIGEFSNALLIGLFGTAITQTISLLAMFAKFITNVETLKMHETITHKLLDYLSDNRNST